MAHYEINLIHSDGTIEPIVILPMITPPNDPPNWWPVEIITNALNVRTTRAIKDDNIVSVLRRGQVVIVDINSKTTRNGYQWFALEGGNYIASAPADNSRQYITLLEDTPPDDNTAIVAPSLIYSVPKKQTSLGQSHAFARPRLDGTRDIKAVFALNIRGFLHAEQYKLYPAALDATPAVRKKHLHMMNNRESGAGEPFNAAILTVYLAQLAATPADCIARALALIALVKQQTDETGEPLIRLKFVLNDSVNSTYSVKGEQKFHTGSDGHLSAGYYLAEHWRDYYLPFLEAVLPEIVRGNEQYIFGFTLLNEPQLGDGFRNDTHANAFCKFVRVCSRRVFELTGGKYPIGIGLANTWHITPSESGVSQAEFSDILYSDLPHIHFATIHLYQLKPPVDPNGQWLQEQYAVNDIIAANKTGRPVMVEEIGSNYEQPAGVSRELADEIIFNRLYIEYGVYCLEYWGFQLDKFGWGEKDGRALDYAHDPVGSANVSGVIRNYAWRVLWNMG